MNFQYIDYRGLIRFRIIKLQNFQIKNAEKIASLYAKLLNNLSYVMSWNIAQKFILLICTLKPSFNILAKPSADKKLLNYQHLQGIFWVKLLIFLFFRKHSFLFCRFYFISKNFILQQFQRLVCTMYVFYFFFKTWII